MLPPLVPQHPIIPLMPKKPASAMRVQSTASELRIQSVMRNPLVMRNLLATQDVDPSASALGSGPRPGYFLTIFSCIARSRLTRSAWVRTRAESA